MSGLIPGHGYREALIVTPCCKCGWRGTPTWLQAKAREQFERHKATFRHPGWDRTAPRRHLAVVDGDSA